MIKSGKAPDGTRAGGDIPAWGSLLVTLASSSGVLPAIIGNVKSWLKPDENRTVTLEIDGDKLQVTGISSEQQRELIDAWLSRHGAKMNSNV